MKCKKCSKITTSGHYITTGLIVCRECYDQHLEAKQQQDSIELEEDIKNMDSIDREIADARADRSDQQEIDRMINEGCRPGGKYYLDIMDDTGVLPGDTLLPDNEPDLEYGEDIMDSIRRLF